MATLAKVVTTCQCGKGHPNVEGNRQYMLALFERAARQQPDVVCFPEAFTGVGVQGVNPDQIAEPVPGPTTDAFARRAKESRCYVICPIRTKRNGCEYNSAVIIDRDGQIAGVYDKVHPVTTSPDYTVFERGITPGPEPPVFDLDFGRIGIQICFDAGFPETWAVLAKKGAKLVFWPSAYHGGFPLQAYAYLHHYYVVTSVRTDVSRIINPCGRVIAETDSRVNLATANINLDFVVCHYDFNWGIPDRIMDAYPGRVRVTSYRDDGHFIVEPTDPSITTEQLRREFGFESTFEYHDRHRAAYREIAEGKAPTPQKAAHGNRAQYSK